MEIDWKYIVRTYERPLYWHIRRMVVSHDDASDILQEVFIQAFNNIGKLRDYGAVRAWLYRIATNRCLRFLEQFRYSESLDEVPQSLLDRLEESEYVDYDDVAGVRFQKALLTLTPQQKAVFTLRYYDDLSYAEISEITGAKVDVLKASYCNARKKVKEYLLEH